MSHFDPNFLSSALVGGLNAGTHYRAVADDEENNKRAATLRLLDLLNEQDRIRQQDESNGLHRDRFEYGRDQNASAVEGLASMYAQSPDGRTSDPGRYQQISGLDPTSARQIVTSDLSNRRRVQGETEKLRTRRDLITSHYDSQIEGLKQDRRMPVQLRIRMIDDISRERDNALLESATSLNLTPVDVDQYEKEFRDQQQASSDRGVFLRELEDTDDGISPEMVGASPDTLRQVLSLRGRGQGGGKKAPSIPYDEESILTDFPSLSRVTPGKLNSLVARFNAGEISFNDVQQEAGRATAPRNDRLSQHQRDEEEVLRIEIASREDVAARLEKAGAGDPAAQKRAGAVRRDVDLLTQQLREMISKRAAPSSEDPSDDDLENMANQLSPEEMFRLFHGK